VTNPKRLTYSFILEVWIDPDGFDSFVDNRLFCSVCTIFSSPIQKPAVACTAGFCILRLELELRSNPRNK
jgi:hypothetical protein